MSLASGSSHILLVDDDHDVCEALCCVLEDAGYVVTVAHHGADALIKLSQMKLPQLILLDLSMPQLSGPDFLREMLLDPTYSRIPVVVVSGSEQIHEEAAAIGAYGYLKKPLDPTELLRIVGGAGIDWDDDALAPTERQPTTFHD